MIFAMLFNSFPGLPGLFKAGWTLLTTRNGQVTEVVT